VKQEGDDLPNVQYSHSASSVLLITLSHRIELLFLNQMKHIHPKKRRLSQENKKQHSLLTPMPVHLKLHLQKIHFIPRKQILEIYIE
jgi:hypothetical protein